MKTIFPADYAYWRNLRQDPERYEAEKERIADQVIALLDQRYPGLAGQVEMRDVATPDDLGTLHRQLARQHGRLADLTEQTFPPFRMSRTLPGLKDFYMAGQWVEPGGGVPTAAMSGRNVIQILCKKRQEEVRNADSLSA